jgi:hypothetical protein
MYGLYMARVLQHSVVPRVRASHPLLRSTLLVTEECLLHPSRNPHLGKADIERILCEYLGAQVPCQRTLHACQNK